MASHLAQNSQMKWVIPEQLARWQRPGYLSKPPTRKNVEAWIQEVQAHNIKSIICLLPQEQLDYYSNLKLHKDGLLGYYEEQGFHVYHVSIADIPGRTDHITQRHLDQAFHAFLNAPKPVLVHCSAGVDRTGRIVNYICNSLKDNHASLPNRF